MRFWLERCQDGAMWSFNSAHNMSKQASTIDVFDEGMRDVCCRDDLKSSLPRCLQCKIQIKFSHSDQPLRVCVRVSMFVYTVL